MMNSEEFTPETTLELISKLTSRQLEILTKVCEGKNYQEIGDDLFIKKGTVSKTMSDIYVKLGLWNIEDRTRRRDVLRDYFCTALNEIQATPAGREKYLGRAETYEHDLVGTKARQLSDSDRSRILRMVEEDESEIIHREREIIHVVPLRQGWNLGRALFLILVGAAAVYALGRIIPGIFPGPMADTQLEPQITEVIVYQDREVTVEVTSTSDPAVVNPSPVVEYVEVVITATSLPSSPTPEPIVVQEPGFVFVDDFELGPDPAWEVQYGEPGMSSGNYSVLAEFDTDIRTKHFALIDGLIWDDVQIDFRLDAFEPFHSGQDAEGAVILHYDELNGGVGFRIFPGSDGLEFGILSPDKEWTEIPSSHVDDSPSLYNRSHSFRIEVIGDAYIAYVDDVRYTSASIEGFDVGKIGLWFLASKAVSYQENFAPRFQEIRIESME